MPAARDPSRRQVLAAGAGALGCAAVPGRTPVISGIELTADVDVHCHTFCSADLPIVGFVAHYIPGLTELSKLVTRWPELAVRALLGVIARLPNAVAPTGRGRAGVAPQSAGGTHGPRRDGRGSAAARAAGRAAGGGGREASLRHRRRQAEARGPLPGHALSGRPSPGSHRRHAGRDLSNSRTVHARLGRLRRLVGRSRAHATRHADPRSRRRSRACRLQVGWAARRRAFILSWPSIRDVRRRALARPPRSRPPRRRSRRRPAPRSRWSAMPSNAVASWG